MVAWPDFNVMLLELSGVEADQLCRNLGSMGEVP